MTADQTRAAAPDVSAWVTASAGTGKTTVLIDRLVRLLLAGTPPERILCLTFTRAAAAEMAIRINDRLAGWTTMQEGALADDLAELTGAPPGAETLRAARSLFAHILDAPGGLRIETIHAFCQSVLGRFPIEAGVSPQFRVADEREQQELLATARARTLQEARRGTDDALADALAVISANVAEKDFDDLLRGLTSARSRIAGFLRNHQGLDGALAAVAAAAGLSTGETEESIAWAFSEDTAFDGPALRRAVDVFSVSGKKTEKTWADAAADWLAADIDTRAQNARDYAASFLTNAGTPRKHLPSDATAAAHPDIADAFDAEIERVQMLSEKLKAAAVARSTGALLRLGARLLEHYDREKAHFGALDYDDQIERTRALLAEPGMAPWVLYKLDGGIDHLLVDEAQDTSPAQWEIIERLTGEFFNDDHGDRQRTLFAVGDEKQSIFSFQGADPYALAVKQRMFREQATQAQAAWRDVPLELSFRSAAPILEAVDATFADDAVSAGVVFQPGAIHHEAFRAGHAGLVELWPTIAPRAAGEPDAAWVPPVTRAPDDDPRARLATVIAKKISDWLTADDPKAASAWLDARDRRIRPGDIMIVVRARTVFVEYLVSALKSRNVPVAGVDRMVLSDQLPVMDLMALGDFLLMPDDDLTLAVVLKSPLVGLGEDDLFKLAYDRGTTSLWQTLRARRGEAPIFDAACTTLEALLERVDYVPPYELFADILSARGGREAMIRRLGIEINDPIDEFLTLAQDYQNVHPPSLQGFLHWVRTGQAQIKRDLEHGAGDVRILTAHGAKGLQAPVVFMPDTTGVPDHRPNLLWHGEEGAGIPLWPGPKSRDCAASAAARADDRRRQEEEYRRLLYVAMTRAEDRLYICGAETTKGRAPGCWYDLAAAGLTATGELKEHPAPGGLDGPLLRIETRQAEDPKAEEDTAPGKVVFAGLDAALREAAPAEPEPSQPLAPSREFAATPPAASPLGEGAGEALRFGRLAHRLLELLPETAPGSRAATAAAWLARPAFGLSSSQQKALATQVLAIVDDPELGDLFGPDSLAEVPITAVVGERTISGQVDRLVVTNENVIVVDYKTGRAPPEDESGVPQAYLRQMAAYRAALGEALPGRGVRCGLLYTHGAQLIWLSDTNLDAHAP